MGACIFKLLAKRKPAMRLHGNQLPRSPQRSNAPMRVSPGDDREPVVKAPKSLNLEMGMAPHQSCTRSWRSRHSSKLAVSPCGYASLLLKPRASKLL